MPPDLKFSVERIQENCEPALCTVLFMGGAGGSLRAGVTDNPVRLTRSVKDALTRVTSGGAPVYVWPGGGITFMVDVTQMPAGAFGYVPTPALVAPIEFTLKLSDYAALGGHMDHVRPLSSLQGQRRNRVRCPAAIRSGTARMTRLPQIALLSGRQAAAFAGRTDRSDRGGEGAARRTCARPMTPRRGVSPDCSTSSARSCRSCARRPIRRDARCKGVVARRMHAAVAPFAADHFITPMAAVAGTVAEEILGAMLGAAPLERAYVNNGGDIALHLGEGEHFSVGLMDRPDRARPDAHHDRSMPTIPSRGIATSGRHGRSFSLGIADAVTVLARTASQADAAATIIANAVDLPGHPAIIRCPANELQPDSDLGARLVTRDVGELSQSEIAAALESGAECARQLFDRGIDRGCRACSFVAICLSSEPGI